MFSILLVLLIIVSVFMIGLILLQKSEGSGMSGSSASSMLGGMLTGAAAGNFLTRLTAWLAVIFFVLCAALALVSSKSDMAAQQSDLRNEIVTQETADAPISEVPADSATVTE
ncbi:MAG: preprotein translocase subunit SecG [Alphaproteobacteria bacterium]|jgi:preprotein translocase subunit SecG|nr:preprotein translocase subunit SecG [Alphaproteobacteria bacterium]